MRHRLVASLCPFRSAANFLTLSIANPSSLNRCSPTSIIKKASFKLFQGFPLDLLPCFSFDFSWQWATGFLVSHWQARTTAVAFLSGSSGRYWYACQDVLISDSIGPSYSQDSTKAVLVERLESSGDQKIRVWGVKCDQNLVAFHTSHPYSDDDSVVQQTTMVLDQKR